MLDPGTRDAPLGVVAGPVQLPPMTMVFAMVDGGKQFAVLHRKDARQVHKVIAACIQNTLRRTEQGYLCRMQDGEMKYMVAFHNPSVGL